MRRVAKGLAWTLAVAFGMALLVIGAALVALNIAPGRGLAERLVAQASGGQVVLRGIGGRFPDALRVARIDVSDSQGVWLTARDATLDWSPLALLRRDARIDRLEAAAVAVARFPVPAPSPPPTASPGGGAWQLPVRVDVAVLHVGRIELAAAVAGAAAVLTADGNAHLASLQQGMADVTLRRVDGDGSYHVAGRIDAAQVSATMTADEPAHGLAATLGQVPDLGALSVQASVAGPWSGAAIHMAVAAGPLRAEAHGQVDIGGQAADLDVTATAPAMAPRPDVTWQAVALEAHVHGPFSGPQATGHLRIDGLAAGGAAIGRLSATLDGNAGQAALTARADGLRLPGPRPDLFAAAPVTLTAQVRLDAPERPVAFTVAHPLLALRGEAQTGGDLHATAHLDLADLSPFAAAAGVDLQGRAALDLTAGQQGESIAVAADGMLGITGGMAPVPGLVGTDARLDVAASLRGGDVALSRLQVDGRTMTLAAHGGMTGGKLALDWQAGLSDLSVLAATAQGALRGSGHVRGATGDLSVQAEVSGEVATPGVPRGPLKLSLTAQGLPGAPSGHVTAEGVLDGAPLTLDAGAERQADGTLKLAITRAAWKSAHAEAAMSLAPNASLPDGRLKVRADRLDDFRGILGQPLTGSLNASADLGDAGGRKLATLSLEARSAGLAGTAQVGRATLTARVFDPATDPDIDAKLDASGLEASGIGGGAQVAARGKPAALAVKLQAALRGVGGADLSADGAAVLNVPGRTAAVSALQTVWKGETVRLLEPVRVAFGGGVTLDHMRLGVRNAVLELAGRATPTLDLTVALRNVTADLARIVAPELKADGALQAEARLGGTLPRPTGTVRVSASGVRMRTGPAAGLPAASLTADATLAGSTARINVHLAAGRNDVVVSGTAPIDPAATMDLRARGGIDLAVLNPLVAGQGRQVRGQVTLDAAIGGTLAAPRADGTLRLAGGEVQDFAQGARISDMRALIQASGDTVRIASFTAKAGGGTLGASGTVGLGGAMPVDLHLTAKNAAPLSSDKLTAVLDMDMALRGDVRGELGVSGTMKVDRADIRIPDNLPVQVAVLNVRLPGQAAPPPPAPAPAIALDVTLTAPGQVFVRGRGLFAELQGRIHVTGTAAAPQPAGKFTLRRGEFNLAGRALTFTTGEVGFDGSGTLDPTLNFIATSTNGSIVATLAITGYASAPKITLSSIPELPQDEVLAQLLFRQSASSLSALQLAEAAAALAQISGVAGGAFDPLNSVRQDLGLDRLSVGGAQNGAGATVEAGRYVAKGVYVGAKQGTSGTGTQATVQIDLLRGLKLETDVGTGGATSATGAAGSADPNGTSVGLTYRFDY